MARRRWAPAAEPPGVEQIRERRIFAATGHAWPRRWKRARSTPLPVRWLADRHQEHHALARSLRREELRYLVIEKGQAGGADTERERCEVRPAAANRRFELRGTITAVAETFERRMQVDEPVGFTAASAARSWPRSRWRASRRNSPPRSNSSASRARSNRYAPGAKVSTALTMRYKSVASRPRTSADRSRLTYRRMVDSTSKPIDSWVNCLVEPRRRITDSIVSSWLIPEASGTIAPAVRGTVLRQQQPAPSGGLRARSERGSGVGRTDRGVVHLAARQRQGLQRECGRWPALGLAARVRLRLPQDSV